MDRLSQMMLMGASIKDDARDYFAVGDGNTIRVYEHSGGNITLASSVVRSGRTFTNSAIAIHPNGNFLVAANTNSPLTLNVFSLNNGQLSFINEYEVKSGINSFAFRSLDFTLDGEVLVGTAFQNSFPDQSRAITVAFSSAGVPSFISSVNIGDQATSSAVSPDGQSFVTASRDAIRIHRINTSGAITNTVSRNNEFFGAGGTSAFPSRFLLFSQTGDHLLAGRIWGPSNSGIVVYNYNSSNNTVSFNNFQAFGPSQEQAAPISGDFLEDGRIMTFHASGATILGQTQARASVWSINNSTGALTADIAGFRFTSVTRRVAKRLKTGNYLAASRSNNAVSVIELVGSSIVERSSASVTTDSNQMAAFTPL